MKSIKPIWLFFVGLTLFYLSFSPGTILQMGYMAENIDACNQIISNLGEWARFDYATTRVIWPRHGLYELIFELPFMLIGNLLFGPAPEASSLALSVQPVLVSSLLCALLFAWVRRITGSLAWAFVLSTATALSTLIWPYAYIGLETTQSLFLLITAFLAIEMKDRRTWKNAILFSVCAAMAISLKSNGIFLAPAVAYLMYVYFEDEIKRGLKGARRELARPLAAALIVLFLYLLNAYIRTLAPIWHTGVMAMFLHMNSDSWTTIFFNAFSFFGSANKGLFVYAPIALLTILALRPAFKSRPEIAIFATVTLLSLVIGCSMVVFWADETWGPRYLHSAIAPLVLLLAASRIGIPFRARAEAPLLALALLGVLISFPGVAFSYSELHKAAMKSGQSTLENLQGDPAWNHIRFNLKLMGIRASGGKERVSEPVSWPPEPHWWYGRPLDTPELKTVDLRDYSEPQPLILRIPSAAQGPGERATSLVYMNLSWVGLCLLIFAGYVCLRGERAQPATRRAGAKR